MVLKYPKTATGKIAQIVKILVQAGICSQGVVSIQPTDPTTLKVIRLDNIKPRNYDELAQLLPNSPMADPDYLRDNAIRVDNQRFLISTSSYSEADLAEMLAIWSVFDMADGYAVLRYVLRYLQWDHGIAATDFVQALVRAVQADPARHPAITWLLRHFHQERLALGGWGPLYAEIGRLAADRFGVAMDSGFATALQVNELLLLRQGRHFPETHTLRHDFVCYFESQGRGAEPAGLRLADLPPGTLLVTDPFGMCELDFHEVVWRFSAPFWDRLRRFDQQVDVAPHASPAGCASRATRSAPTGQPQPLGPLCAE